MSHKSDMEIKNLPKRKTEEPMLTSCVAASLKDHESPLELEGSSLNCYKAQFASNSNSLGRLYGIFMGFTLKVPIQTPVLTSDKFKMN